MLRTFSVPAVFCCSMVLLSVHAAAQDAAPSVGWEAAPDGVNTLVLHHGRQPLLTCAPALWGPNWAFFGGDPKPDISPDGTRTVDYVTRIGGTQNDLHIRLVTTVVDRTVTLQFGLSSPQGSDITQLCYAFTPSEQMNGGKAIATFEDGSTEERPLPINGPGTFGGGDKPVRRIELRSVDGKILMIDMNPARAAGFHNQLRIQLAAKHLDADTPVDTTFTVTCPGPVKFYANETDSYQRTDTSGWFEYSVGKHGTPVDLSFLNKDALGRFVPAGAHGFLTVKGDGFVFEDGTPARFWGVNVTAGAVFSNDQRAEQIADRLARMGVNVVRFHHLDQTMIDYKHPDGTTQHLNDEMIAKMDLLVFELEKRGIYVNLSAWVGRHFRENDGVAAWDKLARDSFGLHPYIYFDPRMQELLKLYLNQVWTHVNPFTGKAYKDDPGIIVTEIINEGLFRDAASARLQPYRDHLRQIHLDWCAANNITPMPDDGIFKNNHAPDNQRFFMETQQKFYADMHAYLRQIGVRIPIISNNWYLWPWEIRADTGGDYMDIHGYYSGDWLGAGSTLGRLWVGQPPATPAGPFSQITGASVLGKALGVSEYGDNPPKTYRSSYYPGFAAVACLQGWDIATAYAYTQSPHARDLFWHWGAYEMEADPASVASLAAGALIYRRRDVQPAKSLLVMTFPGKEKWAMHWENNCADSFQNTAQFNEAVETRRVAVWFDDQLPPGYESAEVSDPIKAAAYKPRGTELKSETGELWRDWQTGVGTINTPRTQAAYGMLGHHPPLTTRDCTFAVTTPFATVVLSSLTDQPITDSRSLLLTTVARAENTGMLFNLSRSKFVEMGKTPFLAEPVVGRVSFATTASQLVAYPIAADGSKGTAIPLIIADGRATLTLTLTTDAKTLFYEIQTP